MSQLKYFNPVTQEWEPTIVGANGEKGDTGIIAQSGEPSATDILWLDTDEDGVGIPSGGASGQVLAKIDSDDFNTEWVTPYTQSDAESDISTAIANVVDTAPAMLDTLNELSAALNDDPNFATTVADALAALVPAGTINQTARATAPTGYLLCDGSAISRTTYSALFDAIGTAYGNGDGSTTFNIPNLKGRVPVGYDPSQSEFDALGETGGAKTHTLTVNEMPSHTHTQNAHSHEYYINIQHGDGTIVPSESLTSGLTAGGRRRYVDGTQNTTATNQNTGGGEAHNNLQPYVVLNYMIKI